MDYQYIKNGIKQLYSVYHEPRMLKNNTVGVVLCYPLGQELIRCHKLYVNLAQQLSNIGYHVLRFDFTGMGDSCGDFSSFTIEEGIKDIGLAVDELKEGSGITEIILIGVRFGATLALLYSQKNKVDKLVFWNPIINGAKYLSEIEREYTKFLSGSFIKENKNEIEGLACFGFQFSPTLVEEIRSITLKKVHFMNDTPILLIDDAELFSNEGMGNTSFERTVNKEYWLKRDNEIDKSFVPNFELAKTIEWIEQTSF